MELTEEEIKLIRPAIASEINTLKKMLLKRKRDGESYNDVEKYLHKYRNLLDKFGN